MICENAKSGYNNDNNEHNKDYNETNGSIVKDTNNTHSSDELVEIMMLVTIITRLLDVTGSSNNDKK